MKLEKNCVVIALTEKTTSGEPNFVEVGHKIPFKCTKEILEKVHQRTHETVSALNLKYCALHLEMIIQKRHLF